MNMLPNKSTREIFRDCLRLIPKMVHEPQKVSAVRNLVKREFYKHKDEKNPEKIQQLRFNAIRGISNYLLLTVKDEYKKNPNNSLFFAGKAEDFEETAEAEENGREISVQEMQPAKK